MPTDDLPPVSQTGEDSFPEKEPPRPEIPGYQIFECLGRGGMGMVWRARQHAPRREVALKQMNPQALASERARARFRREVDLAARLEHANIARIYDCSLDQQPYFFTMELIKGRRLDKYVQEKNLRPKQIMALIHQVCLAMSCAHEHEVIHRDLKPSNILVTEDGEPHIVDFGVAKRFDDTGDAQLTVSDTTRGPGTLVYMSPEQVTGREVDLRSDVYSVGVVAYQLLTGRFPYDVSGSDYDCMRNIEQQEPIAPRRIVSSLDRDLEAILLATLAKDPMERYQTMSEFAMDIENWLDGRPLRIKPQRSLNIRIRRFFRDQHSRKGVGLLIVIISTFSFAAVKALQHGGQADARSDRLSEHLLKVSQTQHAGLRALILVDVIELLHQHQGKEAERRAGFLTEATKEFVAANFLLDTRDPDDKREAFQERLGTGLRWFSHYIIGEDFLGRGQKETAIEHFQKSLDMASDDRHSTPHDMDLNGVYKKRAMAHLWEISRSNAETEEGTDTP